MINRLYNLDYLRGLAAFGIMIFHYFTWSFGVFSSETFVGRFGIYGVSIFYILSGLTLYHVYYDKMKPNKKDLVSFFKRRILRIFPLLWVVTITAIIIAREIPNFTDVFLNLSGLFGFFKWDTYFSTGVWSIGNELVFYAFFPIFILLIRRYKPIMILLASVLFGLHVYFAFVKLNTDMSLVEQWSIYVNPLNQVFLFLGGFFIGHFLKSYEVKNSVILTLLSVTLLVFIFYPTNGSDIQLVTGINRMIFSLCCFLICICFYKLTFKLPKMLHNPLSLLGKASYSVYLLHPFLYNPVGRLRNYGIDFSEPVRLIITILVTLVISYFVYNYFEKYFMKFGREETKIITLDKEQKA